MIALALTVIICCLAQNTLGFAEAEMDRLVEYKNACITTTDVDPAAIEQLREGLLNEADEKLACFAACMLHKLGIMDVDLTIHLDVAVDIIPANIPRATAHELVNKCKNIGSNNPCTKGGLVLKCLFESKEFSTNILPK